MGGREREGVGDEKERSRVQEQCLEWENVQECKYITLKLKEERTTRPQ